MTANGQGNLDELDERLRAELIRDAYSTEPNLRADVLHAKLSSHAARARWATWVAGIMTALAGAAIGLLLTSTPGNLLGLGGSSPHAASQPSSTESPLSPSSPPEQSGSPISIPKVPPLPLFARDPDAPGFQAQTVGRLSRDDEGCLLLVADGGAVHLLAWPWPGTMWDSTSQRVVVDGVAAKVESRVALVGGVEPAPSPTADEWVNPPHADCWRPERYLVFAIVDADD